MADEVKDEVTEKLSAKEIERAKKVIASHGVTEVFFNSKGEVFTQKCNAVNSEKGDRTKVRTYKAD